jgi:hypothetical protein
MALTRKIIWPKIILFKKLELYAYLHPSLPLFRRRAHTSIFDLIDSHRGVWHRVKRNVVASLTFARGKLSIALGDILSVLREPAQV